MTKISFISEFPVFLSYFKSLVTLFNFLSWKTADIYKVKIIVLMEPNHLA